MTDPYDPARLLVHCALGFVGSLIFFCGAIVVIQIFKNGEANTESWAALTGLIGWACGTAGTVYAARFGTTQQSQAKDAVIAQQARTAAVTAGVSGVKTETINVQADTANVTEK